MPFLIVQVEGRVLAISVPGQKKRAERFEHAYHEVRSELGKIHEGRMWKLWMAYLAVRDFLLRPFRRALGD